MRLRLLHRQFPRLPPSVRLSFAGREVGERTNPDSPQRSGDGRGKGWGCRMGCDGVRPSSRTGEIRSTGRCAVPRRANEARPTTSRGRHRSGRHYETNQQIPRLRQYPLEGQMPILRRRVVRSPHTEAAERRCSTIPVRARRSKHPTNDDPLAGSDTVASNQPSTDCRCLGHDADDDPPPRSSLPRGPRRDAAAAAADARTRSRRGCGAAATGERSGCVRPACWSLSPSFRLFALTQ